MSGLEGTSTCWTGVSASVLLLIIVWAALIGGLKLIVRDKRQAENKAQLDIVRRVEADLSCRGCHCPDPQLVHWLPGDANAKTEPPRCVLVSEPLTADPARASQLPSEPKLGIASRSVPVG